MVWRSRDASSVYEVSYLVALAVHTSLQLRVPEHTMLDSMVCLHQPSASTGDSPVFLP